jgi:hypothetical protein
MGKETMEIIYFLLGPAKIINKQKLLLNMCPNHFFYKEICYSQCLDKTLGFT